MKASKLPNGFWFISYAQTDKGEHLRNLLVQKIGNQINYFGTDHWDDARNINGKFKKVNIEDNELSK